MGARSRNLSSCSVQDEVSSPSKGLAECFIDVPLAVRPKVLPKKAMNGKGAHGKHFTKPFEQPDAPDCTFCVALGCVKLLSEPIGFQLYINFQIKSCCIIRLGNRSVRVSDFSLQKLRFSASCGPN